MEIKIEIDDVDYDSLVELMMPMLMDHFSGDTDDLRTRLLLLSKGFTESTVRTILSLMSKEKKDELFIKMINKNKPRIMDMLTEMAMSKGVRMKISDVRADL